MSNIVRMYDTDSAGILYFGQVYRFANDAFESMMENIGLSFHQLFQNGPFLLVIVHSEADYLHMLHIGDPVTVTATVSRIGNTSFEISYQIFKKEILCARMKTIHVCLDFKTKEKMALPDTLKSHLLGFQA